VTAFVAMVKLFAVMVWVAAAESLPPCLHVCEQ
jgi:hypothetical protein